jgi:hypothetical protein
MCDVSISKLNDTGFIKGFKINPQRRRNVCQS